MQHAGVIVYQVQYSSTYMCTSLGWYQVRARVRCLSRQLTEGSEPKHSYLIFRLGFYMSGRLFGERPFCG